MSVDNSLNIVLELSSIVIELFTNGMEQVPYLNLRFPKKLNHKENKF